MKYETNTHLLIGVQVDSIRTYGGSSAPVPLNLGSSKYYSLCNTCRVLRQSAYQWVRHQVLTLGNFHKVVPSLPIGIEKINMILTMREKNPKASVHKRPTKFLIGGYSQSVTFGGFWSFGEGENWHEKSHMWGMPIFFKKICCHDLTVGRSSDELNLFQRGY